MSSVQKVVFKLHDILIPTNSSKIAEGLEVAKFHHCSSFADINDMVADQVADVASLNDLAKKLELSLKDAKKKYLCCKEVLIPCDLISNIANEIVNLSQDEPCGVRGCVLFINLEERKNCLKIGSVKCGDENTVETFELHLKLKKENVGWQMFKHILPDFLQKSEKDSTVVISQEYVISKKKLYRSWS